ncbi:hypothetical protein JO972_04475 [Verrucomicrobiaceae bacterium 5K15]|uniref:FeoB-associated Cys-rich membrane protein n=1 Tax=Oceaniferula flava TaxID=2800421 RepID=A0AAE2SAD7_9BACT|nr:hypothetical protein [Oceaniferula flavus]MBK1854198.1 hypothetical protein [Oceaniferula flavus]MBM1135504.1 hypothetical protein [Oceaniferula flavus]
MDWENWQSYAAPAIVLVTIGIFIRRWVKAKIAESDAKCCGGRCGCAASKRKKLQER